MIEKLENLLTEANNTRQANWRIGEARKELNTLLADCADEIIAVVKAARAYQTQVDKNESDWKEEREEEKMFLALIALEAKLKEEGL